MAAPLPWRKFPRDLMVKPEIQYIIKRLAPEKRHAVFTVMTALYCYADDGGVVDISDRELFVDICLFTTFEELTDILDRLDARKLITWNGIDLIKIEGWDPPLTAGTCRTGGEAWSERMQRTAQAAGRRAPDEPSTAELAALAAAGNTATDDQRETPSAPEAPTISAPAQEAIAEPALVPEVPSKKRKRSHKKKQNDTETKNVSVSQSPEEIRGDKRRGDENRGEKKRQEESTHTQITPPAGDGPAALVGLRPPCGGDGPPPGLGEQVQPRPEKEEAETEPRGATDKSEGTAEGETGTGENASRFTTDNQEGTHQEDDTDDEAMRVLRRRMPPQGIPGLELEKPFHAFWTYFKRQNPLGYANPKAEEDAMMALSVTAYNLGSQKTPPEIIACTMVGAFQRLINQGGYFEGMPCIPTMLLKRGNYEKTFKKLQETLFPRGNAPESFRQEWQILAEEAENIKKTTANEVPEEVIALSYEKYGIKPDDPDRFIKLRAAQKASGE